MMACVGQYRIEGENVACLRHLSRDGREYYVFLRAGYPPVMRREKLGPVELLDVYESDPDVMLVEEESRKSEVGSQKAVPAGGV